ncbi:MAG: HAD family hydrolase [Acidobacteriota bacterium]
MSFTRSDLENFKPKHEFFVGIDSDGCVFDSMEPKHKECFCPVTIEKWRLAGVSKYTREAWEFVNLYSKDRGCNRFLALLKTFDLLRGRPEVQRRGVEIPPLNDLLAWTRKETKLGNPALREEIERTRSQELERVLDWSLEVNESVTRVVQDVRPFPLVRDCLEKLRLKADVVVVSSTPGEALLREWEENDISQYVAVIAGQEMGSKKEHLELATRGKYQPGRVLMIGDAVGDLKAARANDVMFYPIEPGREEGCWERFCREIIDLFMNDLYGQELESALITEFDACLPLDPPWGGRFTSPSWDTTRR